VRAGVSPQLYSGGKSECVRRPSAWAALQAGRRDTDELGRLQRRRVPHDARQGQSMSSAYRHTMKGLAAASMCVIGAAATPGFAGRERNARGIFFSCPGSTSRGPSFDPSRDMEISSHARLRFQRSTHSLKYCA
jgi:hypothetical protein